MGIEEKMKNDDLIMYLTFHPQMVDNVRDFEPCSKPEFLKSKGSGKCCKLVFVKVSKKLFSRIFAVHLHNFGLVGGWRYGRATCLR